MVDRKKDHIDLAFESQVKEGLKNNMFYYEPLFGVHPKADEKLESQSFLGKTIRLPLWISSMTGGTEKANYINHSLAELARDFQMGMGLVSCRPLLDDSKTAWKDFDVRDTLGDDVPFFANIGIAQLEQLQKDKASDKLHALVDKLRADGLIIHINPLQEWYQNEGDRFALPPIKIIEKFIEDIPYKIIVKEVGQGMGPRSLKALLDLKLDAIEFAAFGGTNFSYLEKLRKQASGGQSASKLEDLVFVGHDAFQMVDFVNDILERRQRYGPQEGGPSFIISGGIKNTLEGFFLMNKVKGPAVFGHASKLLALIQDSPKEARSFLEQTEQLLLMAERFLSIKGDR